MKKIIVAIAMLLVATLAISVSAATAADFGAETYYLGNPVKTAPVLDATFGANEYTVTYTLDKGIYLDAAGNVLATPADASALTSAVKVGVAYDVENLYIAIESTLAANVASAEYEITAIAGGAIVTLPSFNEANAEAKKVAYKTENGKFVGEIVIDLDNDDASAYGTTFQLVINEETKNAEGETLNKAVWNVIKLTVGQKFEMNGTDSVSHTFVLGSEATLGDKVTVEQEPVGVPGQTLPVVTEAPTTEVPTEAPTTDAPTEAPTTDAPTEAPTTAPVTEAPTTEAPDDGGCGSSVAAMGIALVAALGTCAVVVSKKED